MKIVTREITEGYAYENIEEFEAHREYMRQHGFRPSQSTEWGYINKNLDDYYGEYFKHETAIIKEKFLDFDSCCEIPHLTLSDLKEMNDGTTKPVFVVYNLMGKIHTADWRLYSGNSVRGFKICGAEGITNCADVYTEDSYENNWIAFTEKPMNIPIV